MNTNRDIIARYDEILCQKVSKMQLIEVEATFDRAVKSLTTQIAELKAGQQQSPQNQTSE